MREKLGGLALPLVAFNIVCFIVPVLTIIYFSIHSPEFSDAFPDTSRLLRAWDQKALPDEELFSTFARELPHATEARTLPGAGRRLNYEISGYRSLLTKTAAAAKNMKPPFRDAILAVDNRWADLTYWKVAASASHEFTPIFLLAAVDMKIGADGEVEQVPSGQDVYLSILARTFWMSFVVTALCLALAYPTAFLISSAPPVASRIILAFVMVPFWMSLLVRTAAWLVLLQKNGLVNQLLGWIGLIDAPLQLVFNRIGVYLALVHIMLPFAILPLFSVMRGISKDYMRAAASLGARPTFAFLEVYVPQTVSGLAAAAVLVFVLSIGFYITPALLGGPRDQMISYTIAQFAGQNANWGMAGALALVLIASVVIVTGFASILTRSSR